MITRTTTIDCYKYAELTDAAKETARNWYREASAGDNDYAECVIDDASQIAELLGIDLNDRNGKPAIYFSGFWSQGDGACFEGRWTYKRGMLKAVKDYAPKDAELHRIALKLTKAAARTFYTVSAKMTHSGGHYYHSGCMSLDVEADKGPDVYEEVKQAMRDFADWIYRTLEKEYDYQNADAQVAETIIANEYEFDADGGRI